MDLYLKAMKVHNIDPNFWISEEYFKFAKFKEIVVSSCLVDKLIGVISNETKQFIFPPISLLYGCGGRTECPENGVWSDFSNASYTGCNRELLDLEYLYNPKDFTNMVGKKWAVFRKNVRKWPKAQDGNFKYFKLDGFNSHYHRQAIKNLLVEWLEDRNEPIEDSDALLHYALCGENRGVLYHTDRNEVVGINCWDSNWKYINFRWSICKKEPFLNEFMRYLFYRDPEIRKQNKLVNDGGVLDNPNIKAFKDKMNPVRVREVHQWKSIQTKENENGN